MKYGIGIEMIFPLVSALANVRSFDVWLTISLIYEIRWLVNTDYSPTYIIIYIYIVYATLKNKISFDQACDENK